MSGRNDVYGVMGTSFHAKRWLALDPSGFFGISLSLGVHLYALGVIFSKLISNSLLSIFIFIVFYLPTSTLALVSLFKAAMTDPGAVPMGARPLVKVRRAESGAVVMDATTTTTTTSTTRALRRCHKCDDNFKPVRAHHDSVTGRCIVKFDHYCPWVNNSIGCMNHKFFCLFLLYTIGTCLLSLLLLLIRVIHCGYYVSSEDKLQGLEAEKLLQNEQNGEIQADPDQRFLAAGSSDREYLYEECNHFYDSHTVLGLVLASLLFLVFCCAMGCEQLEAISSGQGKIARMKMRVGQQGTEFARVTEEFNEMFGGTSPDMAWHWFWPSDVQYPRGMKKVVLGYEWDETLPPTPYREPSSSDDIESGRDGGLELKEVSPSSASSAPLPLHAENLPLARSASEVDTRRRNRSGEDIPKVV